MGSILRTALLIVVAIVCLVLAVKLVASAFAFLFFALALGAIGYGGYRLLGGGSKRIE